MVGRPEGCTPDRPAAPRQGTNATFDTTPSRQQVRFCDSRGSEKFPDSSTIRPMTAKGNHFRLSPGNKPCPACYGAPPLVLKDGRLVPDYCERCEGRAGACRPKARAMTATRRSGSAPGCRESTGRRESVPCDLAAVAETNIDRARAVNRASGPEREAQRFEEDTAAACGPHFPTVPALLDE
jgi:hypothetical protein